MLKYFSFFSQIFFYNSKYFMPLKKNNLPTVAALQPYSQNQSTSSRQIWNPEKQANKNSPRNLLNVSSVPPLWSCCDPPLSYDLQLIAKRTENSGRTHWEAEIYTGAEQSGSTAVVVMVQCVLVRQDINNASWWATQLLIAFLLVIWNEVFCLCVCGSDAGRSQVFYCQYCFRVRTVCD